MHELSTSIIEEDLSNISITIFRITFEYFSCYVTLHVCCSSKKKYPNKRRYNSQTSMWTNKKGTTKSMWDENEIIRDKNII